MSSVIDKKGFRECVGMILLNRQRRVFWAKRLGHGDAWQFPQGGVLKHEIPEEALYRELWEEIGLQSDEVRIIAKTSDWLRYKLPKEMINYNRLPVCKGQKQQWFLLEMLVDDKQIALNSSPHPEFETWRWVDYWYPIRRVIHFKKQVYRHALQEFSPIVHKNFRCRRKR